MRPQIPSAVSNGTGLEDAAVGRVSRALHTSRQQNFIAAVENAWAATLPSTPFEMDKSWSDIGVDSLKALEFVLRLERALGVRVSFDAMTAECTAHDLIRLLADGHGAQPRPAPQQPIFLIPGILGDEPMLAKFRRALSKDVTFATLELPDIDSSTRILRSVAATATALVERVFEIQPDGDIFLAGFSFGGLVAQDMARQLQARQRTVRFLAVLDAPFGPTATVRALLTGALSQTAYDLAGVRSALGQQQASAAAKPRTWTELRAAFDRPIFAALVRSGFWETARRFLLRASSRHDPMWLNRRRRRLLHTVRGWAVFRWRPMASATPILLVTSTDNFASLAAWQSICPRLRVTETGVGHGQLFDRETMTVVRPAFLQHLADVSKRAAA
jgi:thioesterase domain-containing protein/acyl carrier protein